MPAEPMAVDPLLSYARRDGESIRVVLRLPTARFGRQQVSLRLQGDGRAVRARAVVTERKDGRRIETSIPCAELSDGIWRLKLRVHPKAPLRNLRTKLLVSDTQPVALLPRF